jgi:hypothetical protein
MNDFAVWQMELQHMEGAALDILDACAAIAEESEMTPRAMLGALAMAQVYFGRAINQTPEDFEAMQRLQRDTFRKAAQ